MQQTASTLPTSEHFRLERIAEGVYAAIGVAGGAAYSNAGIVDLGNRTIVFDTFMTTQAAEDLRTAAEQLTGCPPAYVINSHAHSDHWCGNQVFFPQATIIATHEIRETMPMMTEYLELLKKDPTELKDEIRECRERLETETDERWRTSLKLWIIRMQYVLESLPTLELRLPDQTFEGELVFHGTRRTAKLLTLGRGHTSSDCFLVLPAEKAAFIGDLGFFQEQPFMGHCDPQAWVAQLDKLEQWDIEPFIPGHGPVGSKADITLEKDYITTMERLVAQVIEAGGSLDDALQLPLPEPFEAWSASIARYEANVHFLYHHLADE